MIFKPLTNGKVSGTGTIQMTGKLFGGILLSTDGTNAGAVSVYDTAATGEKVFDLSSKSPGNFLLPCPISSGLIYYTISGTGASAQLYELVM